MATQLQLRRGTTSENASFTGAVGEVTVDTTKDTLIVQDGSTAGGHELAKADGTNITGVDSLENGGNTKVLATATGIDVTGEIAANGGIALGDNDRIKLGDGPDLQIWHNGSDSYVMDSGTGNLKLLGSAAVEIQSQADNSNMIVATAGGAVTLYNANAPKLATTATGIDVTGNVVADGLTVDGAAQFNTGGGGVAEFYHTSGVGGLRVTGAAEGSASTIFLSNDKAGTPFDIYSFWGNGSDDSLEFFSGGTPVTGTKRLRLASNGDISFYEDTGTTAKMVWSSSAESLGIGQAPTSALHVINSTASGESIATLEAASSKNGYVYINGDDNRRKSLVFQSAGVDKFSMGVGDSDELSESSFFIGSGKTGGSGADLVIDSSGRVGIGVNSPSQELHVVSSGESDIRLQGSGSANHLDIFHNASDFGLWGTGTQAFKLATGGTQRMGIGSTGQVLIGRTTTSGVSNGHRFDANGFTQHVRDGSSVLELSRGTSDGDIQVFKKDGTTVGSIGARANDLSIGTGDTGLNFWDASNNIIPESLIAGAARDNAISLGASGVRFKDLYLSGGVYLGGTGAANLLDDYEEGTWTPTVYASDGTTVLTLGTDYAIRTAAYTKIGQFVRLSIRIEDLRATKDNLWFTVPFASADNDAVVGSILPSAQLTPTSYGTASIYATFTKFRLTKGGYQYPYGSCSYITNS